MGVILIPQYLGSLLLLKKSSKSHLSAIASISIFWNWWIVFVLRWHFTVIWESSSWSCSRSRKTREKVSCFNSLEPLNPLPYSDRGDLIVYILMETHVDNLQNGRIKCGASDDTNDWTNAWILKLTELGRLDKMKMIPLSSKFYVPTRIKLTCVNKMEAIYERPRIKVTVEPGSTIRFTRDLSIHWLYFIYAL